MTPTLRFRCAADRTPLVNQAIRLLGRALTERAGTRLEEDGAGKPVLLLDVRAGIGAEGFRIDLDPASGACRVTGNDDRGLLYGIGKFLRSCCICPAGDGGVTLVPAWQGVSAPKLPVRGMYFATHFHNFYHDAPVEAVERYVEDLALWGCNTLSVWYDMHHYAGILDPAAQTMIERLHVILRAANRVGITASLCTLANEAYDTSPPELRADPFPHHYHRELCPSKPAGLELIVKWRREMLEAFADLEVGYIWIWPYDQGGCKCPACNPWGGNGFVRAGEAVGKLVRELMPRAKTVVSMWEFGYWDGDAEWELFYKTLAAKPDWVDYLMAEGHGDFPPYILKHGPPPGYSLLNFPEISMNGNYPWGAYGANLQPRRLQKVWNTCRHWLAGGFPYSEGIYEDLNKVICLQLYWAPERAVEEIVREYAASEFAPAVAADVTRAVFLLEANMKHSCESDKVNLWTAAQPPAAGTPPLYVLPAVQDPNVPFGLLDAAAARMPRHASESWRWRLLWLRAALDLELHRNGGRPTDQTDAWFEEIGRISYAENAEWSVAAVSRRHLARLTKGTGPKFALL